MIMIDSLHRCIGVYGIMDDEMITFSDLWYSFQVLSI